MEQAEQFEGGEQSSVEEEEQSKDDETRSQTKKVLKKVSTLDGV